MHKRTRTHAHTHTRTRTHTHTQYNCTESGIPGGGGEYVPQSGFGWTNGVTLHFLSLYPDITLPQNDATPSFGWISVLVLLIIFIVLMVPCVLWCRWMYRTGEKRYWRRVQNEHLLTATGGRGSPTTYANRYVDELLDTDRSSVDGELYTWDV